MLPIKQRVLLGLRRSSTTRGQSSMLASCASFSVDFLLSLTVQGDQGQVVAVGPFLLAFPSPLWPTPPHLRPVSIVWAVEVHFVICRLHFIQQAFPRMHLPFQNSPLKAYFPLSEYTLPFRTRFSCVLDRSSSAPSPCTGLPSPLLLVRLSSLPRPVLGVGSDDADSADARRVSGTRRVDA